MQLAHKEEVTCSGIPRLPRLSLLSLVAMISVAPAVLGCKPLSPHDDPSPVTETGDDCVDCHRSDYEAAVQPLHVQELPLQCENCHDEEQWSPALGSDHDEFFERRFAHAEAGCGDCHQGAFGGGETPTACVGCHREDYQRAARPPHDGLPTNCTLCHDERGFSPSLFDHEVVGFELEGQHAVTMCTSCHGVEPTVFEGTPSECVDCHADRARLASPPHEFEGEIEDLQCDACHTTEAFKPSLFVHTFWELTGGHAEAACVSCHDGDNAYRDLQTSCAACHLDDYETAAITVPGHGSFSTTCEGCHSTERW